jgi:hypothetical protein
MPVRYFYCNEQKAIMEENSDLETLKRGITIDMVLYEYGPNESRIKKGAIGIILRDMNKEDPLFFKIEESLLLMI